MEDKDCHIVAEAFKAKLQFRTVTMLEDYTATGGARIGSMNASFPFAKLTATAKTLDFSVRLLGKYSFSTDQVVSIERYTMIPVLGWGVRVNHTRSDYPEKFIFWCLGSPETVLRGIREAGFAGIGSAEAIVRPSGFAFRWSAAIAAILVWNLLFWIDLGVNGSKASKAGPWILLALLLGCTLSIVTLKSPNFQALVMKPGRSVSEIRAHLRLFAFISGFLTVVFAILWITGALAK